MKIILIVNHNKLFIKIYYIRSCINNIIDKMKYFIKLFGLCAIVILCSSVAFAKPVELDKARQVGATFLQSRGFDREDIAKMEDAMPTTKYNNLFQENANNPAFYVFNVENGFVVVSGDDVAQPILGYSDESTFDVANMPNHIKAWFEYYNNEITDATERMLSITPENEKLWKMYESGKVPDNNTLQAAVTPLMKTKWNQAPHYNKFCPGGSVVGCVATAMAQVMKYWECPKKGNGSHSYNHYAWGTISANFAATTYDWANMTNTISSSTGDASDAVALLSYHCGVAVDMDYGESSGSQVIWGNNCALTALKNYFRYSKDAKGYYRYQFSDTDWDNMLKNEIDKKQPVIYAGFGTQGGHAFVTDGYDADGKFHFNWGWGGAYDGYFVTTALNPSGVGIGGGAGGFNSSQQIIQGLAPADPNGTNVLYLTLSKAIQIASTTIPYKHSFGVQTRVRNSGVSNFTGDIAAAVFDADYTMIDTIGCVKNVTLNKGQTSGDYTFTTTGMSKLAPGLYNICVVYRQAGTDTDWDFVSHNTDIKNVIQIIVENPNKIELASAIIYTPTDIKQAGNINATVSVTNTSETAFAGEFMLGLFSRTTGELVQELGRFSQTTPLTKGAKLPISFTSKIDSTKTDIGTYFLQLCHTSSTNWELTGSTNYKNPITLVVKAPVILEDTYEPNDTRAAAYALALNFNSNNVATKYTTNANFHKGTDIDYYKITLTSGYDYVITARLHDSKNAGNGGIYKADAMFSFSNTTSDGKKSYDDICEDTMKTGRGTVTFKVVPAFEGATGTYLLEIKVQRIAVGVDEELIKDAITISPNPATNNIIVDLQNYNDIPLTSFYISDMAGNTVLEQSLCGEKIITLPTNNLANGSYFINFVSQERILTKSLVISR